MLGVNTGLWPLVFSTDIGKMHVLKKNYFQKTFTPEFKLHFFDGSRNVFTLYIIWEVKLTLIDSGSNSHGGCQWCVMVGVSVASWWVSVVCHGGCQWCVSVVCHGVCQWCIMVGVSGVCQWCVMVGVSGVCQWCVMVGVSCGLWYIVKVAILGPGVVLPRKSLRFPSSPH